MKKGDLFIHKYNLKIKIYNYIINQNLLIGTKTARHSVGTFIINQEISNIILLINQIKGRTTKSYTLLHLFLIITTILHSTHNRC